MSKAVNFAAEMRRELAGRVDQDEVVVSVSALMGWVDHMERLDAALVEIARIYTEYDKYKNERSKQQWVM